MKLQYVMLREYTYQKSEVFSRRLGMPIIFNVMDKGQVNTVVFNCSSPAGSRCRIVLDLQEPPHCSYLFSFCIVDWYVID